MLKANLKPKSEHPLDPRPPNPLDMARAPLMAPNASVIELEAALAAAKTVCDRADASLAALDQERAAVMIGGGSAAEIDAQLEELEQATSALTRRRALAGATEAALVERLAASREAEAEKRKREAYEKTRAARAALGPRLDDLCSRSAKEWRGLLREFCQLEILIRQVNSDLPQGAAPIPSAERLRDAPPSDPEIEVRELGLFVDKGGLIVAEEGAPGVSAQPRPDGLFDVSVGSAEWTGGAQWPRLAGHTCSREAFVDISTFKRRVSRPLDPLAKEIAIPAARAGDCAGWASPSDRFSHPAAVLAELDRLESLAPGSMAFTDLVSTKRMRLDAWRKAST